jgi:hypothetical protein
MDEVVVQCDFAFSAARPPSARVKSARTRIPADVAAKEAPREIIRSDSEGVFWFEDSHTTVKDGKREHRGISSRERQQLREIDKSGVFTESVLREKVVALNDENSDAPRLRTLDWACTNFAKGFPKTMLLQKEGTSNIVDPNLSYEGELRRHHRLLFDPFRRGTHIFFEIDGIIQRTTVGQLNFIKWCIENGVDKYVEKNLPTIRMHMASASKRGREQGTKKRRRELTRAPTTLVRGVLMARFDVVTESANEIDAARSANSAAIAGQLARDLADEDDEDEAIEKARKLASSV